MPVVRHQRLEAPGRQPVGDEPPPVAQPREPPGQRAADRQAGARARLELAHAVEHGRQVRGHERALEQVVAAQRLQRAGLAARMLDVDVELDAVEARQREVLEPGVEREAAEQPPLERVVGDPEPAADGADVELDHVDAEVERGVERAERVALDHGVRAAMPHPLRP